MGPHLGVVLDPTWAQLGASLGPQLGPVLGAILGPTWGSILGPSWVPSWVPSWGFILGPAWGPISRPSWGQSGETAPPDTIPRRPEPRYEYVCLGTGAAHEVCAGALCHGCLPWLRPLLHPQLHPWLHSWVRPQPIRAALTTKTESLNKLQNRLIGFRAQA